MEEQDYAAYLALRAIGEATTRTRSIDLSTVKDYMLSDSFALQGYKAVPYPFDHGMDSCDNRFCWRHPGH